MLLKQYEMLLNEERIPYLEKIKDYGNYFTETLNNPQSIYENLKVILKTDRLPEEHVWLLALDVKLKPIGLLEISHGTNCYSVVSEREVFIRALLAGASSIMLIHNHPSLDITPSEADELVSKKIKLVGEILGVNLVDFIIFGNGYCSFRECGKGGF